MKKSMKKSKKNPHRQRHSSAGFTLLEILLVVAILGILANLAIPQLREAMRRAHAAAIIADMTTVNRGVVEFARDNNTYPAESQAGVEPKGLGLYLRSGIRWSSAHAGASYDWENWIAEDGVPLFASTGIGYGVSVVSSDVRLLDTVDEDYDGWTVRLWDNRLVFVIEGLSSGVNTNGNGNGNGNNGNGNNGNGNGNGNNGNGNGNGNNGNGNGNGNNGNGNGNNGNGDNGNGDNGNGDNGNGDNGNGNGNNGNGNSGRGNGGG